MRRSSPAQRLAHRVRATAGDGSWAGVAVIAAASGVVVWVTLLARSHWFFADDWTFLTRAGPKDLNLLLLPLNGHWMAVTAAVFTLARELFGLSSYLPFVVPAIVAHAATGYVLWRWQLRDDVRPWVAALVVAPFLVYGAANENVLFAVNVGFNLSLLLGFTFGLLVEPEDRGGRRLLAAAIVGLAAVPTATTAAVVIAAVAAGLLLKRDWTGAVLGAGPALTAYGVWLLVADGGSDLVGGTRSQLARFVGSLVVSATGRLLGMPSRIWAVGVLVLVAILAMAVARRRDARGPRALTWMLALAALVFAAATAMARVQFGTGTWQSPRYAYVVAAMMLPLVGVAIDRLSRGPRPLLLGATSLIAVAVFLNGASLLEAHRTEAGLEQHLRQRWLAAAQLLADGVQPIPVNVDRYWSPNLHTDHLQELADSGQLPPPDGPIGDPWQLEAQIELRSVLHGPSPFEELTAPELAGAEDGCLVLEPGEPTEITVEGPTGLEFHFPEPTIARLHATTASGRSVAFPRILSLRTPSPRAFWIALEEATTFAVTVDAGGRICALRTADIDRYAGTEPG